MSLPTVLAEIHPGWFDASTDSATDASLLMRARGSALGERMLARWLANGPAAALLAPTPQREVGVVAMRWPRQRLEPLLRDLGVLAIAPAIRAEVGRDAVRRLKQALGNSYLLALDRAVWDGRVEPAEAKIIGAILQKAMAESGTSENGHTPLYAMLDRQGRSELRMWARTSEPALGEWVTLLYPPEADQISVLPVKQVQMLHEHHLGRERSA